MLGLVPYIPGTITKSENFSALAYLQVDIHTYSNGAIFCRGPKQDQRKERRDRRQSREETKDFEEFFHHFELFGPRLRGIRNPYCDKELPAMWARHNHPTNLGHVGALQEEYPAL